MSPAWRVMTAFAIIIAVASSGLCLTPSAADGEEEIDWVASEKGYFNASAGSIMPDGNITFKIAFNESAYPAWVWVLDDGSMSDGTVVERTYHSIGSYTIHLLIVDNGTVIDDWLTFEVEVPTFDLVFEICCYGCVLPCFFLPFAAVGLGLEIWRRWRDPTKKHFHGGMKAMLLLPIFLISLATPLLSLVFLYFPFAGCVSGFLMAVAGLLTIGFLASIVWLVRLIPPGRRAVSRICIIPKQRRRLRSFKESPFYALKDRIMFAFSISPMPMAMIFFIAAFASKGYQSIDDIFSSMSLFYILLAAPFVSILIVPMQLLGDSNLVALNAKDLAKAIQIRYIGQLIQRWSQSVTGFGAIVAFVGVIVDIYTDNIFNVTMFYAAGEAIGVILILSVMTYAGLWFALFTYSFFHETLVALLDRWILSLGLPRYSIHSDAEGNEIRLVREKGA